LMRLLRSKAISWMGARAGLAYSRDGPKKVYIQHKMLEDSEALAKMLYDDSRVFYLCRDEVQRGCLDAMKACGNISEMSRDEWVSYQDNL
jgi:sulfite reductase alpha subunit-like flavoprotein